jgi:hypothetical protein
MEYQTLKVKDKRPEEYEYSDKGKNNWLPGVGYLVGAEITDIDLKGHDYRVPIIPSKRQVKIDRTPNRTYTVSAIAEAQNCSNEIRKLCKKISGISAEIDKILEGRHA